jgi:hypothetical protein
VAPLYKICFFPFPFFFLGWDLPALLDGLFGLISEEGL